MNSFRLLISGLVDVYFTTNQLLHFFGIPSLHLQLGPLTRLFSRGAPTVGKTISPFYRSSLAKDIRFDPSVSIHRMPTKHNGNLNPIIHNHVSLSSGRPWRLFKLYTRVCLSVGARFFHIHPSFFFFFFRHGKGGVSFIDASRLFTRWKDMYHLLVNITYYNINFVSFGTRFFKDEILSTNWKSSQNWRFVWKFTRPFLFLKPNKISNHGDAVFAALGAYGTRVSIILDLPYHNTTIYYLHRAGFYTIAPVPVNYSKDLVDFAIPTGVDSIFTQLFFMRLILRLQKNRSVTFFNEHCITWSSRKYL